MISFLIKIYIIEFTNSRENNTLAISARIIGEINKSLYFLLYISFSTETYSCFSFILILNIENDPYNESISIFKWESFNSYNTII